MRTTKEMIKRKLHSRRGETIAETLISMLIAALALTMLAGAIAFSFNMIQESRKNLAAYYENSNKMATFPDGSTSSGTVTIKGGGDVTKDYTVTVVENNAFKRIKVVAYKEA
ncbi:MAG: hypothetical protein IKF07_05820 [Eubacterium sp.]|nr:hypothetical protein [Eubacterium sp.]